MKTSWFIAGIIMTLGCASQPVIHQEDDEKACSTAGVCETYLRNKMLQYNTIGTITVVVPHDRCRMKNDKIICLNQEQQ